MKIYNIELKIITPVIIHTGEYYDFIKIIPLKDNRVAIVNPEKVFSKMSAKDQNDFFNLIEKDIIKARDIFYNIIIKDKSLIENICSTSGKFTEELVKNPRADVNLIFKNKITGKPYIPGSSIKGAIRTAILENLRKKLNYKTTYFNRDKNREEYYKSIDYELKLLEKDLNSKQKVSNDPFKFLKISDFELQDSKTYFGTARVINKQGEGKGIPVYTEMTDAYCFSQKEVIAKGTISIDDNPVIEYKDNDKIKRFEYKDIFKINNIIKNIDDFYNKITKTEKYNNCKGITNYINDNYYEDEALIRIGRFTQIEAKTFKIERKNEFYDRKTKDGKKIPLPEDININGGVSRTLIDGTLPAGWCIMSLMDN